MLDVFLITLATLLQLGITAYAVDISVREKRIKNAIVIGAVGLIAVGLTGWAAFRAGKAQEQMQRSIDELKLAERYGSEEFSKTYSLGYVIFRLSAEDKLFVLKGPSAPAGYEFDWEKVRYLSNTQQNFEIHLPDIQKKEIGFEFRGNTLYGPKKVGYYDNFIGVRTMYIHCEILDTDKDGIVFLIGFMPKS